MGYKERRGHWPFMKPAPEEAAAPEYRDEETVVDRTDEKKGPNVVMEQIHEVGTSSSDSDQPPSR